MPIFNFYLDEIVAIKEEVDRTEVVRAADFTYSERDLKKKQGQTSTIDKYLLL